MPKNSFLKALFSGPKFSLAPVEKTNKGTLRIGEVVPVYATMINPREGIELNLGHLVRFSPMNVPVMEGYETRFEAFAVPLSAIGYPSHAERDIDDFHNLALNDGSFVNPFFKNPWYMNGNADVDNPKLGPWFTPGKLADYLNFPSMKAFRDYVRDWINKMPFVDGSFVGRYNETVAGDGLANDIFDFVARAFISPANSGSNVAIDGSGSGHGARIYLVGTPFGIGVDYPVDYQGWDSESVADYDNVFFIYDNSDELGFVGVGSSLLYFILSNYEGVANYYGWNRFLTPSQFFGRLNRMMGDNGDGISLNYLEVLYDIYKIDAQTIYIEWFEYMIGELLYNDNLMNYDGDNLISSGYLPRLPEKIDLSYFGAYWKIISDWYINTNIDGDPNEFFLKHFNIFDSDPNLLKCDNTPFYRRWKNDVFTSAVPQNLVTDVNIPVDGTIPDLRSANAYQKLVDILRNTGNRLRDVVFGIRGIKPSAVRSEMSEPIGSLNSFVETQSVLQTSETTMNSPQAAYSGIGTDSSRGRSPQILKYVENKEPTPVIIMVLMSVTQNASYMQGWPRMFSRSSIYDFAIPQLANIGEQEVYLSELYADFYEDGSALNRSRGIFGFNRRYYDWFFEGNGNEIHGEMRDSEDIWHGARIFDSVPALNSEFIEINARRDNLNRVFANSSPEAMPIYYNVYFEGYKTVALPRYIQYDL